MRSIWPNAGLLLFYKDKLSWESLRKRLVWSIDSRELLPLKKYFYYLEDVLDFVILKVC